MPQRRETSITPPHTGLPLLQPIGMIQDTSDFSDLAIKRIGRKAGRWWQNRQQEIAMSGVSSALALTPMWQWSIRAAYVHPTGHFMPFQVEDVEQSIPDRFEQQVRMYPPYMETIRTNPEELPMRLGWHWFGSPVGLTGDPFCTS